MVTLYGDPVNWYHIVLLLFVAVICKELSLDNGMVVVSSSRVGVIVEGSMATHSCNANFILNGSVIRICQSNGLWSASAPICLCE